MNTQGVYFFHIPKTAGMSVWRFLDGIFPANEVCPFWLWDHLIAAQPAELSRWRVFRGHFLSHLEPYVGRPLATFTMLRNPIERSVSHYYHARRSPEHPFYQHANRFSLAEFCLNSETRFMIENYQAAWLAKAPRNPIIAAKRLTQTSATDLQELMHSPDNFSSSTALLESAETRLATFEAFGFTEDFQHSLEQIGGALGCSESSMFSHENRNPEQVRTSDLDPSTLAIIQELTQVDQQLYERARARSRADCATDKATNT